MAALHSLLRAAKRAFPSLRLNALSFRTISRLPALPQDPDFFHYTRGRFVRDEASEMARRFVHFNVDELARVAASAINSKRCIKLEKYPDGMYSKAFLLTMDDGAQVVAKLPNPNAGPTRLTTASEVATMEYMRAVCNVPVPRVHAWSNSQNSSVGAEYIIMEKVAGVALDSVWPSLPLDQRFTLAKTVANYQKSWLQASFSHYGSLYFTEHVAEEKHIPLQHSGSGFAIGPSVGREWFDAGRSSVDFDCGPWSTLEEYLNAIGHREMACVKHAIHLPKSQTALYGPGSYQPTKEKKLNAIESYLTLIKYVCPVDQSIAAPCLWHGDLHVENIFVDPEEPTRIVGIIDWQASEIAPLFYHARQPYFLDFNGPQLHGLERPRLPDNFATLSGDAQKVANALYAKQALAALYRTYVHKTNPCLFNAMDYQETDSFDLLLLGRNLFIDGEATYLGHIVGLENNWKDLIAAEESRYPFSFSTEEKEVIEIDANGSVLGMNAMQSIRESLGELFPEGGVVQPDQYDEAKEGLRHAKRFIIEEFGQNEEDRATWEEVWPYDD